MKLREAVRQAVRNHDANTCGQIADLLRHKGLNYGQIWRFVNNLTGIDLRDWEALMYESEVT